MTPPTTNPSPSSMDLAETMAIHRIAVRMYRQLLGDCFLIRIEDTGSDRHILIDCGLLQGLENAGDRMLAVANDIAVVTGGRLDLLVVTHEHWDHISGFAQAREVFFDPARLTIDRLWMAWTEKPGDPDADRLRERFDDRKLALKAFAMALRADGDEDGAGGELVDDLDRFIGPMEPGIGAGSGFGVVPAGRLTGRRIMEELKAVAAVTEFLEPGQVVTTPGETPLRVAVLGPPRTEVRLMKDLPTKGSGQETFLDEESLVQSYLGVDGDADDAARVLTPSPFPDHFSKALLRADVDKAGGSASATADQRWLHSQYFAASDAAQDRNQRYRQIDDESSNAASLALKLDSDTNNTSLVLAFELPDGSFMVFAADAQVGNWLSWHDQDYAFDDRLSAEQILNRTRLYKVGHHGSHNATLNARGLAMMTHGDLVAMISTVEAEAHDQGKPPGWQMPDDKVAAALAVRCQGRVVIGDRDWKDDTADPQPGFAKALDQRSKLFVEMTVFPSFGA